MFHSNKKRKKKQLMYIEYEEFNKKKKYIENAILTYAKESGKNILNLHGLMEVTTQKV